MNKKKKWINVETRKMKKFLGKVLANKILQLMKEEISKLLLNQNHLKEKMQEVFLRKTKENRLLPALTRILDFVYFRDYLRIQRIKRVEWKS